MFHPSSRSSISFHRKQGRSPERGRATVCAYFLCALSLLFLSSSVGTAQQPIGTAAAGRLQEERPNDYRGAKMIGSAGAVKEKMQQLFAKILVEGAGDGKADKWYSPHLRDISGTQENRDLEAKEVRGKTSPFNFMIFYCLNPFATPLEAACPITATHWLTGEPICKWHDPIVPDGPLSHRPTLSCFTRSTKKYEQLTKPSNFKMCCVREGEDEIATSEWIASKYPDGNGWAGLFEYYYPTAALGWENDRTTTLIVDQQKVQQCLKGGGGQEGADALMESDQAQQWVRNAIEKNLKAIDPQDPGAANSVTQTIRDSIKEVRPKDEKLRFADSLKSEGLTLRVNLAALAPDQRKKTAERFCMHPAQFDKLLVPGQDLQARGGGLDEGALDSIPVWSNYCPEGVKLMTNPQESFRLKNLDGTPTDLSVGMTAWEDDPMYCQRMNLQSNPNMGLGATNFAKAITDSDKPVRSQEDVGYTCLQGGKLNGSMVPVELYRHAAVERRTAITDHALGFLIAGGIAPGMIEGKKSFYKRFEPRPYSLTSMAFTRQTFVGTRFQGGERNELDQPCPSLSGEDLRFKNSSDRLYISDVTNQYFDQGIIEAKDGKGGVNRFRQEWGKDRETGNKLPNRGLDEYSQNYAAPFRIFATCPAGFKRWRPLPDPHNANLFTNLEFHCREENFGGED